jgi:hypothetical protein
MNRRHLLTELSALNLQLTEFLQKPVQATATDDDNGLTAGKALKYGAGAAAVSAGAYGVKKVNDAVMANAPGAALGDAYKKAGADAVNAVKTGAADLGNRAATYAGGAKAALGKSLARGTAQGVGKVGLLERLAKAGIGYVKGTTFSTREMLTELQEVLP